MLKWQRGQKVRVKLKLCVVYYICQDLFFDLFSCYLDFFARVMSYFLEFFTLDIFGTKNLLFAKKAWHDTHCTNFITVNEKLKALSLILVFWPKLLQPSGGLPSQCWQGCCLHVHKWRGNKVICYHKIPLLENLSSLRHLIQKKSLIYLEGK